MTLKRIQPGLDDTTLVTAVHKNYNDLDLPFYAKSGTVQEDGVRRGDVFKRADLKAIDQSINTILLTNYYEKPFQPFFGANLRRLLFELNTTVSESEVVGMITRAIEQDEPRVTVGKVLLYDPSTSQQIPKGIENIFFYSTRAGVTEHTLQITVQGLIKSTGQEITTDVSLSRLR